jgi:hypothetical protein
MIGTHSLEYFGNLGPSDNPENKNKCIAKGYGPKVKWMKCWAWLM